MSDEEQLGEQVDEALGGQAYSLNIAFHDAGNLAVLPVVFGGMGGQYADPRVQILIQGLGGDMNTVGVDISVSNVGIDEKALDTLRTLLLDVVGMIDNPEYRRDWLAEYEAFVEALRQQQEGEEP